ncbi:hypothetical protein [Spirosoma luteolum]
MQTLKMRRQNLQKTQAVLERELADTHQNVSDVTAAMTLKSYTLRPGDTILINKASRVRIEAESIDGKPLGQLINRNGEPVGRQFLLHDHLLSTARKQV